MNKTLSVKAPPTSNILSRAWKQWFTVHSTDPDAIFRERTIRGMVPIIAFLLIAASIFMIATKETTTLFVPLFTVMGMAIIGSAVAISYQKLNLAAVLMFLFPVMAAVGSLNSWGYLSTAGIVMSFLAVLIGAILLSRKVRNYLPVAMIVIYGIIAFHTGPFGHTPTPTDTAIAGPMQQTVEMGILSTMFFGIGYYLLNEFEQRRNQLNQLVATLEDRVAERTRDLTLARQEAEQANHVKSQFLASMSHELRTPLNAILNFTQFVSTGVLGSVNTEQVEMLDKVVHSGKHLLSLINDVLDISKIEAGALKLFVERNVDLAREVTTVVDSGETLLIGKPVQLKVEIAPNLPVIFGDRRRIRQIMLNLLSNACKFTEKGSIRIVLEQQEEDIVFAVHDTGPGIAPEDIEHVFEVFRQTTTGLRQGEGTGLGLPISQRLADAHGGRLWVQSTLGQGASFYVSLPINSTKLQPSLAGVEEGHEEGQHAA